MKQLIIAGNVAYGASYAAATGTLDKGSLALLSGVTLLNNTDSATSTKEVGIAVGNASNKLVVPCIINAKSLTVTKSTYTAAKYTTVELSNLSAGVVSEGKSYSIMVSLAGQPTGARNVYTATVAAYGSDTLETVIAKLIKELNAKLASKGITAAYAASKITLTSANVGAETVYDFNAQCADYLSGTSTKTATGAKAINDAAAIIALYEQCIGGNGIFDPEGNETGYTKPVISGTYTVFNLSFVNPRDAKQTSYQNVIQQVMVAIPTGAAQITDFEAILGKLVDGTIKLT